MAGVNDDPEVLAQLCGKLVRLKIFPYYLHHTDAAHGNRQFRVSLDRGVQIWRDLSKRISGLALPRYVIDPPDGSGKIDVLEYIKISNNHDV